MQFMAGMAGDMAATRGSDMVSPPVDAASRI